MKYLILLHTLVVPFMAISQDSNSLIHESESLTHETSDCDQYREIIDKNMELMKFDEFGKSMIIGKEGEYYKLGMSDHFTSVPKVPDYIYENENINPYMANIIIAHVDLYHCDLKEKHKITIIEKDKIKQVANNAINKKSMVSLFPNPTNGVVNLESINEVKQIVIFDINGRIVRKINHSIAKIDLSNLNPDMYFIYLISDDDIQVEKVILK